MRFFSRSTFLGAGAAIALVGASRMNDVVVAATKANAGDMATLNAAVQLERAGIAAYVAAAGTRLLGKPALAMAGGFLADHRAHLDALTAAIQAGGAVVTDKTAEIVYPKLATQHDVLKFALEVEAKTATTYLSVIADFVDRDLATVVASILGVETTHVALLSSALGDARPYPHAFVT